MIASLRRDSRVLSDCQDSTEFEGAGLAFLSPTCTMFVPPKSPPPDFDIISECSALDDEDIPYAKEFMTFIDAAVTRYHAVDLVKHELEEAGYEGLKESDVWWFTMWTTRPSFLIFSSRIGLIASNQAENTTLHETTPPSWPSPSGRSSNQRGNQLSQSSLPI
jgi:hypothetical protein